MIAPPLKPKKKSPVDELAQVVGNQLNQINKRVGEAQAQQTEQSQEIQQNQSIAPQSQKQESKGLFENLGYQEDQDLTKLPYEKQNFLSPELNQYYQEKIKNSTPETKGVLPALVGMFNERTARNEYEKAQEQEREKFSNKHPYLHGAGKIALGVGAMATGGYLAKNIAQFLGTYGFTGKGAETLGSIGAMFSEKGGNAYATQQFAKMAQNASRSYQASQKYGINIGLSSAMGKDLSNHVSKATAEFMRNSASNIFVDSPLFKAQITIGSKLYNRAGENTGLTVLRINDPNGMQKFKDGISNLPEGIGNLYDDVFDNANALVPVASKKNIYGILKESINNASMSADEPSSKDLIAIGSNILNSIKKPISKFKALNLIQQFAEAGRSSKTFSPLQKKYIEDAARKAKRYLFENEEEYARLQNADRIYAQLQKFKKTYSVKSEEDNIKYAMEWFSMPNSEIQVVEKIMNLVGFDIEGLTIPNVSETDKWRLVPVLMQIHNLVSTGHIEQAYKMVKKLNNAHPLEFLSDIEIILNNMLSTKGVDRFDETRKSNNFSLLHILMGNTIHNLGGVPADIIAGILNFSFRNKKDSINIFLELLREDPKRVVEALNFIKEQAKNPRLKPNEREAYQLFDHIIENEIKTSKTGEGHGETK